MEDGPRDRAVERPGGAAGHGRIGSVTAGRLVLAAVQWPYQYSIALRGGVRDEPLSPAETGRVAENLRITTKPMARKSNFFVSYSRLMTDRITPHRWFTTAAMRSWSTWV